MNSFNSLSRKLVLPMAFFLPFWLTFGRSLFGAGGWMTLIYLFAVTPVLLVGMLINYFLLRTRPDVRRSGKLPATDSILLLLLYISVILHGFLMVDGGDTPESINSVAANLFGDGMIDLASSLGEDAMLAGVFSVSAALLLVLTVLLFAYKRLRTK